MSALTQVGAARLLLACDDYGQLYTVAPDGSYDPIEWENIPYPPHCRVIPFLKQWVVIDGMGVRIATFQTRQNARNFVRFAKQQ